MCLSESGPYWWNPKEQADTPHRVKVNEARLVDGMVPLSRLMVCKPMHRIYFTHVQTFVS